MSFFRRTSSTPLRVMVFTTLVGFAMLVHFLDLRPRNLIGHLPHGPGNWQFLGQVPSGRCSL